MQKLRRLDRLVSVLVALAIWLCLCAALLHTVLKSDRVTKNIRWMTTGVNGRDSWSYIIEDLP